MGDVVVFPTQYEPWMNTGSIAKHFGVSTRTIGRWVEAGMPYEVPPGGGGRLFRVSVCDAWLASGRSAG